MFYQGSFHMYVTIVTKDSNCKTTQKNQSWWGLWFGVWEVLVVFVNSYTFNPHIHKAICRVCVCNQFPVCSGDLLFNLAVSI